MHLLAKTFRNIGLIGRPDKSSVVDTLCLIHDHLI
ncbi:MAG: NAD(+) kinase, partial [Acinetobacter sp.]|nr:NAD(+) kinase [Acinetobacter sp.]